MNDSTIRLSADTSALTDLLSLISEVLEYPSTEFNYWAVVFEEEYYEAPPHERYQSGMTECDCAGEIEKFKRMMRRR